MKVDVDDLAPGVQGDVVQITQGGVDAGVVDNVVDVLEAGDGAGDEFLNVGVVGDVAGLREDLDAGGAGLGGGCGERVRPAGGESEVDALGGEGPENTQADACAGAGENGVPTADVDGRASRGRN